MAQNEGTSVRGESPLKGVILCCTALPQDVRTNLADIALQMGAVHKLDLTTDVTHLIVGDINTAKYKYVAKERPDIKVLRKEWLDALRTAWMEGEDVDVEELEAKYHFPAFSGLNICVTGFDNHEQRTYLSTTVEGRGATYNGDLTKTVTHLIAAAPQGDKYIHAQKWGIHVVSYKWFEDSLRRGMSLDESYYDPTMPVEEQGKGAFKRQVKARTSLGKHGREEQAQKAPAADQSRKKLRRTASTRLEGQSQDVWLGISSETVDPESAGKDQWQEDNARPSLHDSEAHAGSRRPSEASLTRHEVAAYSAPNVEQAAMLSGVFVLIHGFDRQKTTKLEDVLTQNGATIVHSPSDLEEASRYPTFKERYLLVPHDASSASANLDDLPPSTSMATEWWVERCVYSKTLLDPMDDVLSRPLGDAEVPGFADLQISTTGFSGVDVRQIAVAVKMMGATYQEKLSPTSPVLISGSTSIKKEKAYYAARHGIPVVSVHWLWACLETGEIEAFDSFKIELPALDAADLDGSSLACSPAPTVLTEKQLAGGSSKKADSPPKRLSNCRKRHSTPSLSLHGTKTGAESSRLKPIVHEDADDDPVPPNCRNAAYILDGTATEPATSQPLQEVSPNRSPRKTSKDSVKDAEPTTASKADAVKPASRPTSFTSPGCAAPSPQKQAQSCIPDPLPTIRTHSSLTADLAEILNKNIATRTSEIGLSTEPPTRRKSRPLGRASSGMSNRSLSASAQSEQILPRELAEGDGNQATRESLPPPSTQLGYETPEAEAHRLQMSKQMGTKFQDEADMRRLPSLGVVKDSSLMRADAGVGNRVKGRTRAK